MTMPIETPTPIDPLTVGCPDCHAPAAQACIGDTHATRLDTAEIHATLVEGVCTYPKPSGPCGQRLVTYTLHGQTIAVHPDPVDAEMCPPLADPIRDSAQWAMQVNLGLERGRPGLDHFRPLAVCPECTQGKHQNCVGQAMAEIRDTEGRLTDELVACECRAPHPPATAFPTTTGSGWCAPSGTIR